MGSDYSDKHQLPLEELNFEPMERKEVSEEVFNDLDQFFKQK